MIVALQTGSVAQFLMINMIPFLILNLFFICREIKEMTKKLRVQLLKKIILVYLKLIVIVCFVSLIVIIGKNILLGLVLGLHILDILKIAPLYSINSTGFLIIILFTLCLPITVIEF